MMVIQLEQEEGKGEQRSYTDMAHHNNHNKSPTSQITINHQSR